MAGPVVCGAVEHWAFQPVAKIEVSAPPGPSAIDSFVRGRLAEAGLHPAPPADRVTLIRRLFLDMHGLPPSPERVEEFVSSDDPRAYARLVDEVLASPRYGERWAQHWLDIVRYADTHGFEVNTPRENAWPYRDYVIDAFNNDKPYDRFVFEQLAGDAVRTDEALGFLVAAAALLPGQIGDDDASIRLARQDELNEIIVATSETFLALSVGCARCHDHKFDPIAQRDYYAMQAFFAGIEYGDRPYGDPRRLETLERLGATIAEKRVQLDAIELEGAPGRNLLIDDEDLQRVKVLRRKRGHSNNPAGTARGYRDDAGDARRLPNMSGGSFSWWSPQTGKDVLAYRPRLKGRFRIWLSWGVHGGGTHTRDARYVLDHDGNVDSLDGQEEIAVVDQYCLSGVKEHVTEKEALWSGFLNAGVHSLQESTEIFVRMGDTGTVVTADAIILQEVTGTEAVGAESISLAGKVSAKTIRSIRAVSAELQAARRARREATKGPKVFAGKSRDPDATHLLYRGDPEQKRERIGPAVLRALGELSLEPSAPERLRRVALANWVASEDNPLTARVMANRVWQYHFGTGLVDTPSDFGLNSAKPSHPQLLDWLAGELIRSGWSVKHLQRLILLSQTYRQSSRIDPRGVAVDADSRLLWRFPSRRLEAEAIRDSMLLVSGQLNLKTGGPGFNFFKTRGGLTGFPPVVEFGAEEHRRMIYSHKIRMEPVPVFGAFDCPDAGQAQPLRNQSVTAIQALNLFNSSFVLEKAGAFAERLTGERDELAEQVEQAFRLALGRGSTEPEREAARKTVEEHGLTTLCRVLFNTSEFLFLP